MYLVNKHIILLSIFLIYSIKLISKENEFYITDVICNDSTFSIKYKNSSNGPIYFDLSSWIVEEHNKKNTLNNSYNLGISFIAYEKNNKSILSFMNKYCENAYYPVSIAFDYNLKSVPHIIEVNSQSEFEIEFDIKPINLKAFYIFDSLCVATEFVSIDIKILKELFSLIPTSQESRIINVESIKNNCIYVDSSYIPFVIEKYTLNKDKILYLENPFGEISNDTKYFYQLLLTDRNYLTYKIKSPYYIKEE